MIRRREDSWWEFSSNLCKSPGADKIHHNPSFSSCNWFFTWHSNHKFAWATRLPYGEATELFTSLRKLWRVFKTLCPGAWEICYPSVWTHKPESMMPKKFRLFAQKGRKPRELLHYISTPRDLPSKDDTLGAKRDQSVMRQWATGHGKAMQCTTKDSA